VSTGCGRGEGLSQKPNALGKAQGYADGDTMTWMIETQVGAYTS
jgi:hypothetical protein